MPKDGLVIDKNPGAGDYEQPNNLTDNILSKSNNTLSAFASSYGKSYYQNIINQVAPRACAFGMPNSHESVN